MNILEVIADYFKNYQHSQNTPLHVGEVMNLWTMLTATENFMNSEMIALNTVQDQQLREKMNDLIHNYHMNAIKGIKEILLNEGIELPQEPVEKPQLKLEIPPGGKMTDEEIANFAVFNLVWAIKFCARGTTEAVRADVGSFFTQLIVQKSAFSLTMKQLLAEKGWLKVPPPHVIAGSRKNNH